MKTINLFFLLIANLSYVSNIIAQIPTSGMVGHYTFTGNANDEINSAQNGAVVGATLTTDRFGNSNSAYSFNGSSTYISIPVTNFLNNSYTYSYWMKSTVNPSVASYAFSVGSPGQANAEGAFGAINGSSSWGIDIGGYATNSTLNTVVVGTLPNTNQWYHVVVTRNSSYFKLYVDGAIVDSSATNGSVPQYGTASVFNIGTRFNLTYYFNGDLDDFIIYDRALTSSEVTALYNDVVTGNNHVFAHKDNIKIFPNPTRDRITIENGNNGPAVKYTVKVTDLLGETLFSDFMTQSQFSIDLSAYTKRRMCFVQILDDKGDMIDVRKIVIQ